MDEDKEFVEVFSEIKDVWGAGKKMVRQIEKARVSGFWAIAFIGTRWSNAFDTLFPETKLHKCLLKAHQIPERKPELRENDSDFWPEMRWLLDRTLHQWEKDPSELGIVNQSLIKETFHKFFICNHLYAGLSLLNTGETELLCELSSDMWMHMHEAKAAELGKNPKRSRQAVVETLRDLNLNRQEALRQEILGASFVPISDHREYYFNYFFDNKDVPPLAAVMEPSAAEKKASVGKRGPFPENHL